MDIALVKPSWRYPIAGADHTYNRRWPPLELLNCAALLQADGHQVRLVDAQAERLSPAAVASRVGAAEMVILSSSALDRWQCPTLELAPVVAVAEGLRDRTGTLVLTGFHGTVQPAAMLEITQADVVVRGEPEVTTRQLAAGRRWAEIRGLSYFQDGHLVHNSDQPLLDLTTLPVPAFELINLARYHYEVLGPRFVVLEGSRGCPYPCTFCSRVIQGRRLRRKTVEQLGREVEVAVRRFGAKSIYFIDLEFTASRDLAEGISHYILDHKIQVSWCCQTRTDQVDEPLLRLMRRAGCRLIHFGIESGSQRIAQQMRKNIDLHQHGRGLELAKRAGMETLCFFLMGYPGETEAEMRQTLKLAKQLNATYASFHRIAPYQGTPLYEQYVGDEAPLFPAFAGSPQDRRRVDRMVRQAIWSYYMRPRFILEHLRHGSPRSWGRQLRLFAGYFR